MHKLTRVAAAAAVLAATAAVPVGAQTAPAGGTTTPITHVVVIFQENVSFDHYFATYPNAANPAGEPAFSALPNTPSVNGLDTALLQHNPNSANPMRLDRTQALTCDMDHGYTAEQLASDAGLMDRFVQHTGAHGPGCDPTQVMGYFDGNTVTAVWNYAQHYAMSDNSFGTTFGPSTPGALNLVSGQTAGATLANIGNRVVDGTVDSDLDPTLDDCSHGKTAQMAGKNIGDLLNAKSITWGWFEGGFRPSGTAANGTVTCDSSNKNIAGKQVTDYIPHHEPFQYYSSTANPHHLPPTSVAMIGQTDQANHQYGMSDFWAAANAGNLPAVSFLKAPGYQDGHAGYSDPLDEQTFLVQTINRLEQLPTWNSTAIFINYDDSDGWYDHVLGPIVRQSNNRLDALTGTGQCGAAAAGIAQGRCGYGPRLPMLVISPYARPNFVDSHISDQSSIIRFVEDNWQTGRVGGQSFDALAGSLMTMFDFSAPHAGTLLLDPTTGEPSTSAGSASGQAASALPLGASQSGTLPGNSGGSFAYYRVATPSGSAMTLMLVLAGVPGSGAHQIGMAVYQNGVKIGSATALNTGLGDDVISNNPTLTVTPTASGGPVLIQLFDYSGSPVSYQLTMS